MKSLSESERPYEKCEQFGASHLTDTELLAVLLRTGSHGENALDLSRRILYYAGEDGLLGIHRFSKERLKKIRGIGRVKSIQILCISELAKRLAKAEACEMLQFTCPSSIARYYMEQLRHEEQELLYCMMLDGHNHLTGEQLLSRGTANATLITPREVFVEAVKFRAVNLILVHNHPGGDPSPSEADLDVTRRIYETGEMIGIHLLDHIIIGDQKYISFREKGIFDEYI